MENVANLYRYGEPICSAVLTLFRYKQTTKQPNIHLDVMFKKLLLIQTPYHDIKTFGIVKLVSPLTFVN